MMHLVNLLLALVVFGLGLGWTPREAAAQPSTADGVLINADVMDRDMEANVVRLSGNVQVVFQGQHLSCDRAELNLTTQSLRADGTRHLEQPAGARRG